MNFGKVEKGRLHDRFRFASDNGQWKAEAVTALGIALLITVIS